MMMIKLILSGENAEDDITITVITVILVMTIIAITKMYIDGDDTDIDYEGQVH